MIDTQWLTAHLDLRGELHLLSLRNGVSDHHGLEGGAVDSLNGRPRQNTVGADSIHLLTAGLL